MQIVEGDCVSGLSQTTVVHKDLASQTMLCALASFPVPIFQTGLGMRLVCALYRSTADIELTAGKCTSEHFNQGYLC